MAEKGSRVRLVDVNKKTLIAFIEALKANGIKGEPKSCFGGSLFVPNVTSEALRDLGLPGVNMILEAEPRVLPGRR